MAKPTSPAAGRGAKQGARKTAKKAAKKAARPSPRAARAKAAARPIGRAGRASSKPVPKPEPVIRAKPETLRLRSISASLTVGDLERSLALYTKGFGFMVQERWENGGRLEGVTLHAGTCEVNLSRDDGAKGLDRVKGTGIRLWLETVQDLAALAERAESYGAHITDWPADREWGVRSFSADDLDGYHLSFFHKLE
jgi:uncharacterized glyoxalase superfamily protein PhnB